MARLCIQDGRDGRVVRLEKKIYVDGKRPLNQKRGGRCDGEWFEEGGGNWRRCKTLSKVEV